jgi:hypothetical protein
MSHTHRGSCHCGRVAFEIDAAIAVAFACNCSICRRVGAIWIGVPDRALRLAGDASALGTYRFGTLTAQHHFCRHCGVHPFSRPRIDPGNWVVNLRCLDGVDPAAVRVHPFDGEHWEEAAAALMAQRGATRGG